MERSRIKGSTAVIVILLIASQLLLISDGKGSFGGEKERSRNNRTLIVNGSGSRDYSSIYDAIMGASDGDTVYVEAGTYNESIKISKNIKLVGAGAETTTIKGHGYSYDNVIHINTDGVEVTGFTITTEESDLDGISMVECSNCSINDNIINSYNKGISMIRARDIVIRGNTISNLSGNSDEKQLISIRESTHISLMGNQLIGNGISIIGETLEYWNTHTVDNENTIDGKEFIYWNDRNSDTVPLKCGQIILVDCTNVTVEAQKIENCHNGITLAYSSFNNISDNDCSWNEGSGICLYRSSFNTITWNECEDNNYGVFLSKSNFNTIRNNSCSGVWFGIHLENSGDNIIEYNSCSSSTDGINLWYSDNNTIDNNSCYSNTDDGIFLYYSNNTVVTDNRCSGNDRGIVLYYARKTTLHRNVMEENGLDMVGDTFEYFSGHDIPETNTVNSKTLYYLIDVENDTIPADAGQVILVNCSRIVVEGQNMNDATRGISLYFSNDNLISNNTCKNTLMNGLDIYRSSGNTIIDNNFQTRGSDYLRAYSYYFIYDDYYYWDLYSRYCAINLIDSNNNTISDNVCNSDLYNGMTVGNSDNNTISDNKCSGNAINGIGVYGSSNNIIQHNTCNLNGKCGIFMYASVGGEIFNNTCNNNNKSGIEAARNYYSDYYSSYINLTNNTCRRNNHHGIYLSNCQNIILSGNTMWDSGLSVNVYDPADIISYTIDTSNRVNGKPIYFLKEINGGAVPLHAGQVILADCSDVVVRDLTISNTSTAISVFHSSRILIINNTCDYNTVCGIRVSGSEGINITNNKCSYNSCTNHSYDYYYYFDMVINGIMLSNSFHCRIENNSCNYNLNFGILTEWGSYSNKISNNNCDYNGKDGLWIYGDGYNNISNNSCNYNGEDGIHDSSEYNILTDNICSGNFYAGINISSDNSIIKNNNNYNNRNGIYLSSYDNIIAGNMFNLNLGSGMFCRDSHGNVIDNNTYNSNGENGIYMDHYSDRNTFSNNTCNFNKASGLLLNGYYNSITNNSFSWNNVSGISINQSDEGIISFNEIFNNGGYGIRILHQGQGNTIHHNILMDNNNGDTQASDDGCQNVWHRKHRGNYWSDWTTPDEDGDYIVDNRYDLDGTAGNFDIFPLAVKTVGPIAKGGGDIVVEEGSTVQFKGYRSYDNIRILNYTWTFTYGGREIKLYGVNPKFDFNTIGKYKVNLTVTDGDGNRDDDNLIVTVEEKREYGTMVTIVLVAGIASLIILSFIHKRKMRREEDKNPEKRQSKDE